MKETTIVIVGLGLMGGSLALGLRGKNTSGRRIIGIDQDPQAVQKALEIRAVDEAYTDLEKGVGKADIIFLAVPHGEAVRMAPKLARLLPAGALVTDMASIKEGITKAMEILPAAAEFLGGHPMTGSERQGIGAADPYLFENAAYVLTPTKSTSPKAVERVGALVRELGAEVIVLSPERHDQIVAAISHLPHLVAGALVHTVSREEDRELAFSMAAGSFRDGTRVAVSSPQMWRGICLDNRKALLHYLSLYRQQLERVETLIEEGQSDDLLEFFKGSRDLRQKLPPRGKGFLTPLFDVVVLVEDTPGIIGEMASLLGQAGINITEIEVLRVREAEEGSIRFGFKTAAEREKALGLLRQVGIKAWSRE